MACVSVLARSTIAGCLHASCVSPKGQANGLCHRQYTLPYRSYDGVTDAWRLPKKQSNADTVKGVGGVWASMSMTYFTPGKVERFRTTPIIRVGCVLQWYNGYNLCAPRPRYPIHTRYVVVSMPSRTNPGYARAIDLNACCRSCRCPPGDMVGDIYVLCGIAAACAY